VFPEVTEVVGDATGEGADDGTDEGTDVEVTLGVMEKPGGEVTVEVTAAPDVVVVEVPVVAFPSSPPKPRRKDGGNCTGVRKTITQTIPTSRTPASPRNLRLCSSAPRSAVRKKPLSSRKRTMLTEVFTPSAYQKESFVDRCSPSPEPAPEWTPQATDDKVFRASMVPPQSGPGWFRGRKGSR